jgi:hypothetical protein
MRSLSSAPEGVDLADSLSEILRPRITMGYSAMAKNLNIEGVAE